VNQTAIILESDNQDQGTLTLSNGTGVSYAGGTLVTIESDKSAFLNNKD